jgi:hypothetical protein
MYPGIAEKVEPFTFLALATSRNGRGELREMKHFSGILEPELPRPIQKGADQVWVVVLGDIYTEMHPCMPGFGQEGFDGGHRLIIIPEVWFGESEA